VFSLMGSQYDASAAVIARRNGRFDPPSVLRNAPGPFQNPRWGNYTAVAPGPPLSAGGPPQMWISGMYAGPIVNGLPEWITVIGNAAALLPDPQVTTTSR
jgi:hypothetical protein